MMGSIGRPLVFVINWRTLEETAAIFDGQEGMGQTAAHAGPMHRVDDIKEKETKLQSEVATN
ncbi:uncharacterized protein BJ212DRAFT_1483371 [Suillus subaureus]|uniref:Uncharacterized protein n=1 Tax=Suillus subaureus TaxID=48587 RepID=A0A9P7JB68_9AGAM|nr:uncharacterized protein BJ212DRAFT_1483371 [Suillus subaureus]KAG1812199.1 hypothetical protein BJ212DRAFT_1483371 [Suillus subaureus]